MTIIIFASAIAVFLYTMGFAISIWKQKNKVGAIAVSILACIAIVLPYFVTFVSK